MRLIYILNDPHKNRNKKKYYILHWFINIIKYKQIYRLCFKKLNIDKMNIRLIKYKINK